MTSTGRAEHREYGTPRACAALLLCLALLAASPTIAGAATTQRASLDVDGTPFTVAASGPVSISSDGRFVAFVAPRPRLVGGVGGITVDVQQIFVRDLVSQATELVSADADGNPGDGDSLVPSISGDGRLVAFASSATNLIDGGSSQQQIFIRDRATGTTEIASVAPDGAQGNLGSGRPVISGNGLVVAFESLATNLVAGSTGNQVFVRDRVFGKTDLVSANALTGGPGNGASRVPAINADGHYVAFQSDATNLVATGSTSGRLYFVRDRLTRTTSVVDVAVDGQAAAGATVNPPSLSADGRFVAYALTHTQLVGVPATFRATFGPVFIVDRLTGTTEVVSVAANGAQRTGDAPSISGDGRFVAFASFDTDLVASDTNDRRDVFLRDRISRTTERLSVSSAGAQATQNSFQPSVSADGRFVAFLSDANNLATGDTNDSRDVFVRDRQTRQFPELSINDVTKAEGAPGATTTFVFTVNLSAPSKQTVRVNVWVDSGPASTSVVTVNELAATVTSDYSPRSQTLIFDPGDTSRTFSVNVIGDNAFEPNETFVVNLDMPQNAVIARSPGIGRISNDDSLTLLGSAGVTPPAAIVGVHERLTYQVTWTVPPPLNWHDLASVELRLTDAEGIALWVQFNGTDETLALLNSEGRRVGPAFSPGRRGSLESSNAKVHLHHSSVQGSGPTGPSVTLTLDVSFKHRAAGRSYLVEVLATDRAGHEQIEVAGTLTVIP
jgi:Tol biopolymer transport system component